MPDTGQHTAPELSYPFPENVDTILVILLKLHPRRVLPYERLMGMCRWMGSYFHDWIDYDRPIRLTKCCTQFKSPGDKILCALYLRYNVAFTFKWYGNSWNKMFHFQRVWIGYNIELAEQVYSFVFLKAANKKNFAESYDAVCLCLCALVIKLSRETKNSSLLGSNRAACMFFFSSLEIRYIVNNHLVPRLSLQSHLICYFCFLIF